MNKYLDKPLFSAEALEALKKNFSLDWIKTPVLENQPRWRFTNLWKDSGETFLSFSVLTVYWSHQFIGLTIFNFAIEYNRKFKRTK